MPGAGPAPYTRDMGKSKSSRKRRRGRPASRKRGGMMLGMRTGFKGVADAVTGEDRGRKSRWLGRVVTVLLVAAAAALLLQYL